MPKKHKKKKPKDAPIAAQEESPEIGCLTCTRPGPDSLSVNNEENSQVSDVLRKHFWFTEVDFHEATICLICWDQVNKFHKFYVSVEELHQSRLAAVIVKSEPAVTENDGLEECPPEKSDRELDVEPQEQEDSIIFKEEPALEIVDELASDNEQSSEERETRHRPKIRRLALKSKKEIQMEDDYIGKHVKFTCKQCGDDSSPSFELFTKHCMSAHGEKYHPVECCGQLFNRKNLLYEHVQYINNPNIFRCEPCRRSFSYKYGLERHQKTLHASKEEMKFKCEWCPRSFSMQSACRGHMKNHYLRFHCTECPSKFNKAQLLVDHVTEVHPGISPYKCPFCTRTFNTYINLHKHERAMHPEEWQQAEINSKPPASTKDSLPEVIESELSDAEKKSQLEDACIGEHVKFICKQCGENFPNFTQYMNHCEDVHGDKSPSIECCGKQFTRKSRLYEHVRVTKNPDMLRCKMCPKSFVSLFGIDQHMKGVHASREERKFKCDRCPRAFAIMAQFSNHYKRHLAQKEGEQKLRYPCNDCPSIFSSGRYLKDHVVAVHPGVVPFQCPFCKGTYKHTNNFARHVTVMHPVELQDRVAKEQKHRLKPVVPESDTNTNDNPVKLSNGDMNDTDQQQETTISEEDETDLSTDDESDSDCVPSGVDIKTQHLPNIHQLEDELIREHVNFSCKQCEVVSECFAAYLRHSLETHGNDLKFIECCEKQYYQRGHLYDHVRDVNKPDILSCKLCDQKFSYKHIFLKHMKQVHATKKEHLKDLHEIKKGRKYKCDQCPRTFGLLRRYKSHMKCHLVQRRVRAKLNYPCTCATCPTSFSSGELLKKHVFSVHPGSSPYSCPFCKRTMIKLFNFRRHLETMHLFEIMEKKTSSDQPPAESNEELLEEPHSETSESTLEVTNQQQETVNIVKEKPVQATADDNLKNESREYTTMEQLRIEDETIGKHAKFICKLCGVDSSNYTRHMQHALRGHDNAYPFVECCGKQFNSRQRLLQHVQVINNPDIFRCKVCRKNFTNRIGIERHMKIFHSSEEEKKFKCDQCPQSFALKSQLRYHVKRHLGVKGAEPRLSYPCADCPKVFKNGDTLKDHLASAHPGIIPYKCPFCTRSYRIASGMARHVEKKHPNEQLENRRSRKQPPTAVNSPEECQPEVSGSAVDDTSQEPAPDNLDQDKSTQEEEALSFPNQTIDDYIRQHNKLTCKQCGEESPSYEMYFQHSLDAHSNKLTFIECCGKQFKYRFLLYQHVQLINNPNMFRCKLCRRTYAHKYAYEAHMKGQHASKEELKYKCDRCPMSFALVTQYRNHLTRHTIPDDVMLTLKYPCAECPRKFSNGKLLRAHIYDLHSRYNPYKCPYCKKSFKRQLNMQNHVMAVHPDMLQKE